MTPEEKHKFLWRSFDRPLKYVCQKRQPKRVLEWGPGLSTSIIAANSPDAHIYTIEHNPKYFKKMKQAWDGCPNVKLNFKEIILKGGKSTGYVTAPLWEELKEKDPSASLSPSYDLVFVDGRFRNDCLNIANLLVKDSGVVFVHDAHRKNYHSAANLFPYCVRFEDRRTWVMSKNSLKWLEDGYTEENKPNSVMNDEDTLNALQRDLTGSEGYYYTRFGDADLYFIEDPEFSKNRRHDANPQMSEELGRSFMIEDPKYAIGCVAGGKVFSYDGKLRSIADRFHDGKTYHSAISLHQTYASNPDRFVEFVKACFHDKKVLFVGGQAVAKNPLVQKVFNVKNSIKFDDRNAYVQLDELMPTIEKNIKVHDIIVVALGQATRCLAARLWMKGYRNIKFFDVGSTVDALAERPLRSWIKRHSDKVEIYREIFR